MGNNKKIIRCFIENNKRKSLNHLITFETIMSFEGIDNQIERYTKIINQKTEHLKNPELSQDARKKIEAEIASATQERTKWKIRKNNLFTTRHKK